MRKARVTNPGRSRKWLFAIWLFVGIVAGLQVSTSMHIESDMSAFMPRASTPEQAFLLDELSSGKSARLWLLSMRAADTDNLTALAKSFTTQLMASASFRSVYAGQLDIDDEFRELLFRYRYLLDPAGGPEQFSKSALHTSFQRGFARLRSPASPFEKTLVVQDPTDAMRRIVSTLQPAAGAIARRNGIWVSADGQQAFVVVESHAGGTDLDAQEGIASELATLFGRVQVDPDDQLLVSGPPAFAVAIKARIQSEAQWVAVVSTLLLLTFLALIYRNIWVLLLLSVPIGGGLLLASAVTSALWGSVHGISFAFGITLLGVALDYPVHLFSHARPGESPAALMPRIWPTMRLGLLTTIIGFTAMLTADFPGIEQLAVFAITGLIGAALLTRYLLVDLLSIGGWLRYSSRANWLGHVLQTASVKGWLLIPVALIWAGIIIWQQPTRLLAGDIEDLSPIPEALLTQNKAMRAAMGLEEAGNILLVRAVDTESMLQQQEALQPLLQQAASDGVLHGFDMAARVLPSIALQQARQKALPDRMLLADQVQQAQLGLGFRDGVFQPFSEAVAASSMLAPLTRDAMAGSPIGMQLDSLVRDDGDEVIGIINLVGLQEPAALAARLQLSHPDGPAIVNVRGATNMVVNQYRDAIVLRSGVALLMIALMLALLLRDSGRFARVLLPVLGAALIGAAAPILFGQTLTVFHLVSLLLVVGIGLDYALFFSRAMVDLQDSLATRNSIAVCAFSTVMVFSVLSFSQIPVLRAIGVTVTAGTIAAFMLSVLANKHQIDRDSARAAVTA